MHTKYIYANTFLVKSDFYHLAKQFYRHIYRHKELEQESEWKEIKILAENYIVKNRLMFGSGAETPDDKYREFLRFYTELEVKYEDRTEFIFDDCEKELFKKCMGLKKIWEKVKINDFYSKIVLFCFRLKSCCIFIGVLLKIFSINDIINWCYLSKSIYYFIEGRK